MSDPSNPHGPTSTGSHPAMGNLEAWLLAQDRRQERIEAKLEQIGTTVTILQERSTSGGSLDPRVRDLEAWRAAASGASKAGVQGVSWALPVALALLGILASVLTYALTHGR